MSTTPVRPPSTPWLSPYLTVRDAARASAFYERAFGFTNRGASADDAGNIIHVEMTWHDALIMFAPEGASGGNCKAPATTGIEPSFNLYVYCEDVDALYARATAAGARGVVAPADMFWGDRMCQVADPDGYLWNFARHLGPAV